MRSFDEQTFVSKQSIICILNRQNKNNLNFDLIWIRLDKDFLLQFHAKEKLIKLLTIFHWWSTYNFQKAVYDDKITEKFDQKMSKNRLYKTAVLNKLTRVDTKVQA